MSRNKYIAEIDLEFDATKNYPSEVARLLRELADFIEDTQSYSTHNLRDINGNLVGHGAETKGRD